ncbi:MAG: orotate phosphoribosyltransferase [Chloroflexi bacterium]|nr:orotate phosphoribosyltransferase [Chloroflexota bacterium]
MENRNKIAVGSSRSGEVAELLLRLKAVAINTQNPFVYSSGIVSPIYTDLRLLMSYPKERELIVNHLCSLISEACGMDDVDGVAGIATAGIPWAAWISAAISKPMVYVRDSAKEHGKGQRVEGRVVDGQRLIVIEDLVSTGASAISAAVVLREMKATVDYCFAIFTYGLPQAAKTFNEARLNLWTLTHIQELLEVARSRGYLSNEEHQAVVAWYTASIL